MNERVLLMDWGIGGMSVFREIKNAAPSVSCVYISDSGNTPYGKLSSPALRERLSHLISRAHQEWGITRAVIACNAASTVLPELGDMPVPIHGVIEAGVELIQALPVGKIGIIGGYRTIESKIFSSRLEPMGYEIFEQVAQGLSAMIERGEISGALLEDTLNEILAPMREVDALLLACTHYPAVRAEIQKVLPKAVLLDSARATALEVAGLLGKMNFIPGEDEFFTSGDLEAMRSSAHLAFQVECDPRALPL